MGLVSDPVPRRPLGSALAHALTALEGAGIARSHVPQVLNGRGGLGLLGAIDSAIATSPLPGTEWDSMLEILGEDLLASLVGTSATSVGRYRRGQRPTPDPVTDRLHFLVLVVVDLAGSYNPHGVRRWFCRPRPQLDGRTPTELLAAPWDPDEPGPERVADLAGALVGAAGSS